MRSVAFLFLLLSFVTSSAKKIIHITPGAFGNVFDVNVKIGNGQITCYRLRNVLNDLGYTLQQGASFRHLISPEYIIFFDLSGNIDDLKKIPEEKRILFLWEPPASEDSICYSKELHDIFDKIFTWDDTLVDNIKYLKFYYPQPVLEMAGQLPNFNDKKLCTLFVCNKERPHPKQLYSERRDVINFFEKLKNDDFDFYGIGWENGNYRNYKGYVKNKINCLAQYKFSICYENTRDLPGYVTEKIFDSFVAGCVPVYLGANNITDYVPKNCFIDRRDFPSFSSVYDYIRNMPEDEYNHYINNIQNYLKSDLAFKFSSDYFIKNFIHSLGLGGSK